MATITTAAPAAPAARICPRVIPDDAATDLAASGGVAANGSSAFLADGRTNGNARRVAGEPSAAKAEAGAATFGAGKTASRHAEESSPGLGEGDATRRLGLIVTSGSRDGAAAIAGTAVAVIWGDTAVTGSRIGDAGWSVVPTGAVSFMPGAGMPDAGMVGAGIVGAGDGVSDVSPVLAVSTISSVRTWPPSQPP